MPSIRKEGKDTIVFASKEEHATPSKITLPEPEPSPGLLLPSGEINWNCPCLGGMATGPCGLEFRDAFSCFHYSASEPKGSDCYDAFKTMQSCMSEYPALYGNKDTDMDDIDVGEPTQSAISSADQDVKNNSMKIDTTNNSQIDMQKTSSNQGHVATTSK